MNDQGNKRKKVLNVLVVCGSGIATSSMVQPAVEEILAKLTSNRYTIDRGAVSDIPGYSSRARNNVDLVLSTVPISKDMASKVTVPVVVVSGLLYGDYMTREKVVKEIKQVLQEIGYL